MVSEFNKNYEPYEGFWTELLHHLNQASYGRASTDKMLNKLIRACQDRLDCLPPTNVPQDPQTIAQERKKLVDSLQKKLNLKNID